MERRAAHIAQERQSHMLPASVLLACMCHPAAQAADELWCSGVCRSSSPPTDKCSSCIRAALVAMGDEQVSTC